MEPDRINLQLIQQSPKVIGNNIYGTILRDSPESSLGRKLCCLNPEWAKKDCPMWQGVAAEYVRQLNEGGAQGTPHLISIDDKLFVIKALKLKGKWTKHRKTDVFNLEELRASIAKNPKIAEACLGLTKFKYQYIGSDDFANEVLVGNIVRAVFESEKSMAPLYNKFWTQSMCGNYGLILMDYADKTDLYSFSLRPDLGDFFTNVQINIAGNIQVTTAVKPEYTWLIVKQVACALDFLQSKVEFIHSDLKVQNVLLSTKEVSGSYKGVNLAGRLNAKISDYGNAAATIRSLDPVDPEPIRFYNEIRATRYLPGVTAGYELKAKEGSNCFQISMGGVGKCTNALWWKLPSSFDYKISLITAHSGMPFYVSFDLFVFIVSLMMCPNFFSSILSNPALKGVVWDSLWLNEELIDVTFEVMKYHGKRPSLENAINVLKKYHMRCDALPVVIDLMKTVTIQ